MCNNNCIILMIKEQSVHIRKSYSIRKVFLECAVVELVYEFEEKSTTSVSKGKSITKVPLK